MLDRPILLATSNPHKVAEVQRVLDPEGIRVVGLDALSVSVPEPQEAELTFAGNARAKARAYAERTGYLSLADDSGLMVDGLGGEPGVHSARYAGVSGPRHPVDRANNEKLIERLRPLPRSARTGQFVCVMVLTDPERTWASARGEIHGELLLEERGQHGFGYDPLFYVPELGCTTAEIETAEKNRISHRGRATARLLEALRRLASRSARPERA